MRIHAAHRSRDVCVAFGFKKISGSAVGEVRLKGAPVPPGSAMASLLHIFRFMLGPPGVVASGRL